MAKTKIRIFGVVFAKPKGLRKSPGTNWFASCVAEGMSGKHASGRAAIHNEFRAVAHTCRTRGRNG